MSAAVNAFKDRADHTRRYIQNIGIQSGPLKLGLDVANNLVG